MSEPRPRIYHLLGNLLTFHAFPSETDDNYALVEIKTAPGAGAPPNHHAGEDESFFILEGEFEFFVDGQTRNVTGGDFVKIPDGAVHAFTCTGSAPGRLISVSAPGQVHDIFFTQAGDVLPDGTTDIPAPDGPPDIPMIMDVASRAGMTILAPEPEMA